MVLRDRNSSAAISGKDRCVDSSGTRRSSAAVSADAPGTLEPCWSACLADEGLGPVPLAACHRHQRPLAQYVCADIGSASVPDADGILEVRVAALEITAKDAGDPLQERGSWRHDARCREPARGLRGV